MKTYINKRKETNLLLLKKDMNYNTSLHELNKISLNFHLNTFHKKNNSKTGRLYNNYNNITKINNNQRTFIDHSIANTYIKTSSPTTNFKCSNIDISNSNNDLTNKNKAKENLTSRENPKDLQYKKQFHHKKINSHLLTKNVQILNELFPWNTTSNSNKGKDSIYNNRKQNGSKIIKKKNIQIDTFNINNNTNLNNTSNKVKKISNNNNQHKINLKIYLEKHNKEQRVLSTDNNNEKTIKSNSKNKNFEKKSNINSVIKKKRVITYKNSTGLLNNFNYKNITLSRANSSWINKEYNVFNTSMDQSISKNISNKISNKSKINNVIIKNINNYLKVKKPKISDNIELTKSDLLHLNKLKEKTTLYYLTNTSEELKTKKKNYNNGNNIFININNYSNENKNKGNKSNINLTEGKELNIQNYISKKSISQKENPKIRRRNYLKKSENKYKIFVESKNSSRNKTEENFNSYNSENDKIEGPELTHFFLVSTIQKGIKNIKKYN